MTPTHRHLSTTLGRASLAALLLPLLIAGAPAPARQPTDGVTYRIRVTTRLPGGGAGPVVVARGTAAGGHARIDLQTWEPAPRGLGLDDYLLVGDSGRVLVLTPAMRTFRDGDDIIASLLAVTAGGGDAHKAAAGMQDAKSADGKAGNDARAGGKAESRGSDGRDSTRRGAPQIRDVLVATERIGAGDAIDGRATVRYRIAVSYATLRDDRLVPSTYRIEVWTAQLPVPVVNPFDPLGNGVYDLSGPTTELNAKLNSARRQLSGTPVRIVVTQSFTALDARGTPVPSPASDVVQTIQVTQIATIPASAAESAGLRVPAGYTRRP